MTGNRGPELIKRYFDIVERGTYDELRAVFDEDTRYHHPMADGEIHGVDGIVRFFVEEMDPHETFTDRYHEFDDFVVEGDRCVGVGRVTDGTRSTFFLSYVVVADDRISRYVPGILDRSTVLDIIGDTPTDR